MYLTRILVTVLILVPLTLAATTTTVRPTNAKPTAAGKPITPGKSSKPTPAPSKTKANTTKDGITLRLGENSSANNNQGKIITTRLGLNGNPEEQCQCTLFYLCDQTDVVTVTNGEQCPDSSNVCCRLPITSLTTNEPAIPPPISENPVPLNPNPDPPTSNNPQPPTDGGSGGGSTSQSNCICVQPAQCEDPLVAQAGAGLIDPRFSCTLPDICCPPENIIGTGIGYPPTTEVPVPGPGSQGPIITDPNSYQPPPNTDTTPTPWNPPTGTTPGECGVRRPSIDNRISAPEHLAQTSFGEFPWMALILTSETAPNGTVTENVFVCGASLLSPSVVLTAAHCVANLNPQQLRIRVGEYNTHQGASEPMLHQDRAVSRIVLHPEFNNRVLFNDIALIRVTEEFVLAPHIAPICLPLPNTQFADSSVFDTNNCLATGWGKNAFQDGNYQTTLKRVDLALIEQRECENRLRETRLGPQFVLNPSFICAGGQAGFDTCQGDGGGPLVCALRENRNRYVQVGIVSWGIGCASNVPGVYASLFANQEWLNVEYNTMAVFRVASG